MRADEGTLTPWEVFPRVESSKSLPQVRGHHFSACAPPPPLKPEPSSEQFVSWQTPETLGESQGAGG